MSSSVRFLLKITFFYSIVKDLFAFALRMLVGLDGLEPSTSRLSGARSSHLSYRPVSLMVIRFKSAELPFESSPGWYGNRTETSLREVFDLSQPYILMIFKLKPLAALS